MAERGRPGSAAKPVVAWRDGGCCIEAGDSWLSVSLDSGQRVRFNRARLDDVISLFSSITDDRDWSHTITDGRGCALHIGRRGGRLGCAIDRSPDVSLDPQAASDILAWLTEITGGEQREGHDYFNEISFCRVDGEPHIVYDDSLRWQAPLTGDEARTLQRMFFAFAAGSGEPAELETGHGTLSLHPTGANGGEFMLDGVDIEACLQLGRGSAARLALQIERALDQQN